MLASLGQLPPRVRPASLSALEASGALAAMRNARTCALLVGRSASLPALYQVASLQEAYATPLAAARALICGSILGDVVQNAEEQHKMSAQTQSAPSQARSAVRDHFRLNHRPLSHCSQPQFPDQQTQGLQAQGRQTRTRQFASEAPLSEDALRAEVDGINSQFAEAREEIEMALESMDTVYFNEEAEAARAAVQVVLDRFSGLLNRLDEERRGAIQRSMGLKMEQLKGELEQLKPQHE